MKKDPFIEYLKENNPTEKQKKYSWYTAIGLQEVDGLETSDYLKETAIKNIKGEISLDETKRLIFAYYEHATEREKQNEEADKVSIQIAEILSKKAFTFSVVEFLKTHKFLFLDIYEHAGEIRKFNISKKEWILNGASVTYGDFSSLKDMLEYDISQEKSVDYSKFSRDERIKHIAKFIADLWQIHPFAEGNTRTTAVFLIKYLRSLGFDVTNDLFAKNSWYFRNALVRANYNNVSKEIFETTEYLELFLRNLLYNENNKLSNRQMHVEYMKKPDIDKEKPDIDKEKPDIALKRMSLTVKTKANIMRLNDSIKNDIFGRKEIMHILSLSASRSSELIKQMLDCDIIVAVKGQGKGKYIFK